MDKAESSREPNKSINNFDRPKEKKQDAIKKDGLSNLQGGKGHEFTYSKTGSGGLDG